jgi:hypothetical protein
MMMAAGMPFGGGDMVGYDIANEYKVLTTLHVQCCGISQRIGLWADHTPVVFLCTCAVLKS